MSVDKLVEPDTLVVLADPTQALAIQSTAEQAVPEGPPSDAEDLTLEQPLSKNAQRRLRKAERGAALKAARKLKDKEKKVEKKRKRQEAVAAGLPLPDGPRKRPRPTPQAQKRFDARVVVDLGFDDKMNEKEVMSLCNQLSYSYGANRKAPVTFSKLAFSSLNGRTEERMMEAFKGTYNNWKGVQWWPNGYEHLWGAGDKNVSDEGKGEQDSGGPSLPREHKESIVYLTADGDEEISELREGETYIIGGIVDHNRYKNLCKDKAVEQGIRTARLPLGTFLSELPTRKVMTVNQVFDIMLAWLEKRDWREAFWEQIPKRKFQGQERVDESGQEQEGDPLEGAIEEAVEDDVEEQDEDRCSPSIPQA